VDRRLGWQIEKYIIVLIISFSLLDFFGYLNIFGGYVLDIVAWSTIAYIIYAISPTELFFGERHAFSDLVVVLSYVLMSVKDLLGQAAVALPQLYAKAPELIKFAQASATQGFTFTVTAAEMNGYELMQAVPRSVEITEIIARYFTMSRTTVDVILSDGTRQVALAAFPSGQDGMMLMFYNTLVANNAIIQTVTLLSGAILLLCVSVYAAYKVPVKTPSILSVVKEEGAPGPMRVVWVYLFLLGFFVIVFNLLFEWMTITNDAPLLLIALCAIAFFLVAGHVGLDKDAIMERLGGLGEDFYRNVIKLFLSSSTILLGISGFLILHLLTDIGNFLVPAIMPWFKTIYVNELGVGHEPLYVMILATSGTIAQRLMTGVVYMMSVAGLLLLLLIPGIIWYKTFKIRSTKDHTHLPDWKGWQIGIVMACIVVYLIIPVLRVKTITEGTLVGVDLMSAPITPERMPLTLLALICAATMLLGCAIIGMLHNYARRVLMLLPFCTAMIFFGYYIFKYFTSSFVYYASILRHLLQNGEYAVVPVIFLLFGLTVLFFVTGFFSFIYEIWRD